ncbi:MAG: DUF4145 domain-containing protein [Candidatus Eisenbacteria sp.]|nr:DUF4145 domain-containing protein [Candidatus Eisenbacteria bacterium]
MTKKELDELPDSESPSGVCPRCGYPSSFAVGHPVGVSWDFGTTIDGLPTETQRAVILSCRHCRQGVVVIEEQYAKKPEGRRSGGREVHHRGIYWWPLPETETSGDVPDSISSAYTEARTVLAANCPRAAAAMARRTLEAICDDQGASDGSLASRLEALSKSGALHPSLTEWSKEIRLVGNVGAHFDPITKVSRQDAYQLISFIREMLKVLYELPAEIGRRRSERRPDKSKE